MISNDIKTRKIEHIKVVLGKDVEPIDPPFNKYSLPYCALPEISYDEIKTDIKFFGKNLSFPFLISSMTGGPAKSKLINSNLAIAAQREKVALALGSMRVTITHPETINSFKVRHLCPNIPLFANLGIVQLNYGFGINEINRIVDLINADGIFLHINHLQEMIQEEGDTNFKDLLKKLEKIINKIKVPVLAKEVGAGIDKHTAQKLFDIGVKWLDVAGLGGTNWTMVEAYRNNLRLGRLFHDVGIPTDECLINCSKIKGLNLISGGGTRSGVDIAKSLMLGAQISSAAKPLLKSALTSDVEVSKTLNQFKDELRIAMFCIGAKDINELKQKILKRI